MGNADAATVFQRHPTPWTIIYHGVMSLAIDSNGFPVPLRAPDAKTLEAVVSCVNAGPVRDPDFMRWENGFRSIVGILIGARKDFEITQVVEMVRSLVDQVKKLENENATLMALKTSTLNKP